MLVLVLLFIFIYVLYNVLKEGCNGGGGNINHFLTKKNIK